MKEYDKIFVAGHKGMVGSAILRALMQRGYSNIVTASRTEVDLCNETQVSEFMKAVRPQYVFLAAARVGGIQANNRYPVEFMRENLMIQNNVIHYAHKYNVKKLLFLGSSCIYPRECPQPMKEDYLLSGKLEPTNEAYALAKIAGLRLVQYYNSEYGFQGINPMPCNLYGPNDSFDLESSHVLSALVRRFVDAVDNNVSKVVLWGSGIARREFMHVDDLAEALLFLMEKWNSSEIINVGWGTDITIRELADKIAEVSGFRGEVSWDQTKPDGMLRKCLDVTKLNELGYRPRITLDVGIAQMMEEYKAKKAKGEIK